jgi:threonine-phosphate decarboxylase
MSGGDRHGGNVHAAARATGRRVRDLIDFSASINPLGPPPAALHAVSMARAGLVHYPDPDCVALRLALARRHGLEPAQILVGNGSTELIHVLPRALGVRRAVIVGPTFSEYASAVRAHGGQVFRVNAHRSEDYRPPVEAALAALASRRADALVLCNPNSPTGQELSREATGALLRTASRLSVWTILDETFIEYCPERSVLASVIRHPRLVVLRSFTKFYSLPGLRIGYLVAQEPVIRRLKRALPPWSVNTAAQAAGLAVLRDRRYARTSLAFMRRERPRFGGKLASIPGVTVFPSAANFLLVELPRDYSGREVSRLACQRRLLIRDCSTVPGLSRRTIRVAVRLPAQNDRLVRALRALIT